MAVDKTFSQFSNGHEVKNGDQIVGLRDGGNYRFDFPSIGVKDANGNYLYQYDSMSSAAVNYLKFFNAVALNNVMITADGADSDIGISITPKGAGLVKLDGINWPSSDGVAGDVLATDGAGNTFFTSSIASVDYFPFIVGHNGPYASIQEAIDAASLSASASTPQMVLINPGAYVENVITAPFVALSGFGGSGKNSVIIEGNFISQASTIDDIFNFDGITFQTPSGGGAAFSNQGSISSRLEFMNCFFVGSTDTAFENLNPNSAIFNKLAEVEALAGNKAFNISGGQVFCLSSLVNSTDTPSVIDGSCQLNFLGGVVTDSFQATNGAQFACGQGAVLLPPNLLPAVDLDATSLCIVLGPNILCNDPSGYWITGTGTLLLTQQTSFVGSAQDIDPAISIFAQPVYLSTLVLKSQQNALGMNSNFITDVLDPVNPQDAATKSYVDANIDLPFVTVTTGSHQLSNNTRYFIKSGVSADLNLPLSSPVGAVISIVGYNPGIFTITQNAGQQIFFGTSSTTIGVFGTLECLQAYSSINLVCITEDIEWTLLGEPQGVFNPT